MYSPDMLAQLTMNFFISGQNNTNQKAPATMSARSDDLNDSRNVHFLGSRRSLITTTHLESTPYIVASDFPGIGSFRRYGFSGGGLCPSPALSTENLVASWLRLP